MFAPSMKMSLVGLQLSLELVYRVPIRDTDELRKRLVSTWAEFQQSVVGGDITFSPMKKFSILQGSMVTLSGVVVKDVTVCFLLR